MLVKVDYWVAARLGGVWLWLHPGRRDRFGDLPAICQDIASGRPVGGEQTWRAQEFAIRVWGWAAIAVILPGFPLIGIAALLHLNQTGRNVAAVLVGIMGAS